MNCIIIYQFSIRNSCNLWTHVLSKMIINDGSVFLNVIIESSSYKYIFLELLIWTNVWLLPDSDFFDTVLIYLLTIVSTNVFLRSKRRRPHIFLQPSIYFQKYSSCVWSKMCFSFSLLQLFSLLYNFSFKPSISINSSMSVPVLVH